MSGGISDFILSTIFLQGSWWILMASSHFLDGPVVWLSLATTMPSLQTIPAIKVIRFLGFRDSGILGSVLASRIMAMP